MTSGKRTWNGKKEKFTKDYKETLRGDGGHGMFIILMG